MPVKLAAPPSTAEAQQLLVSVERKVRKAKALHREATQRLGLWAMTELTGNLPAQGHDLRGKARETHRVLVQLENDLSELRRLVQYTAPSAK